MSGVNNGIKAMHTNVFGQDGIAVTKQHYQSIYTSHFTGSRAKVTPGFDHEVVQLDPWLLSNILAKFEPLLYLTLPQIWHGKRFTLKVTGSRSKVTPAKLFTFKVIESS